MKSIIWVCLIVLVSFNVASQSDVKLTYQLSKSINDSTLVYVKGKITNYTSKKISFMKESCNGIDYFLSTGNDSSEVLYHDAL